VSGMRGFSGEDEESRLIQWEQHAVYHLPEELGLPVQLGSRGRRYRS
jgi:hypothetical protein